MVGTLLSFAAYALGFVARPLGGLVSGNFGDTIGRRTVLYLSLQFKGPADVLGHAQRGEGSSVLVERLAIALQFFKEIFDGFLQGRHQRSRPIVCVVPSFREVVPMQYCC